MKIKLTHLVCSIALTASRLRALRSHAVLSGYVKPGIGIGRDRPNDWSFTVLNLEYQRFELVRRMPPTTL